MSERAELQHRYKSWLRDASDRLTVQLERRKTLNPPALGSLTTAEIEACDKEVASLRNYILTLEKKLKDVS